MRDEIQIVLAATPSDMFSEEIRVILQNIQVSQFNQRIEMKVYNSDSQELSSMELAGERVLLVGANRSFFVLYTNKQQMHVFSSTSTELIKRGIVVEGVCMLHTIEATKQIVVLTLKGNILVYKVLTDFPTIDSVRLEHQTNILPLLRQANSSQAL